ncbi:MAG: hypothetical protein LBD41_07355, partial [Clostridiales Family XIII bacterium]|nr:hypothetical protein [Clostridiales Family XIII bacterium]
MNNYKIFFFSFLLIFSFAVKTYSQNLDADYETPPAQIPEWNFASTMPQWEMERLAAQDLIDKQMHEPAAEILSDLVKQSSEHFGNEDFRTIYLRLLLVYCRWKGKFVLEYDSGFYMRSIKNYLNSDSPFDYLKLSEEIFQDDFRARMIFLEYVAVYNVISTESQYYNSYEITIYQEILRVYLEMAGPHNFLTIQAKRDLAFEYFSIGDYRQASDLLYQILGLEGTVLDKEDDNITYSKSLLADIYAIQGDYRKARDLKLEAYNDNPLYHGEGITAEAMTQLYHEQLAYFSIRYDSFAMARFISVEDLEIYREKPGYEYVLDILMTKMNLGDLYYSLSDYYFLEDSALALQLYQNVLEEELQMLEQNSAYVYFKNGDLDDSLIMFNKQLDQLLLRYGDDM